MRLNHIIAPVAGGLLIGLSILCIPGLIQDSTLLFRKHSKTEKLADTFFPPPVSMDQDLVPKTLIQEAQELSLSLPRIGIDPEHSIDSLSTIDQWRSYRDNLREQLAEAEHVSLSTWQPNTDFSIVINCSFPDPPSPYGIPLVSLVTKPVIPVDETLTTPVW